MIEEDTYDNGLNNTRTDVAKRIDEEQQQQKERYDKHCCALKVYKEGDLLLVQTVQGSNDESSF